MGTRVRDMGYSCFGVLLSMNIHLAPKLGMKESRPLLQLYASIVWTAISVHFSYLYNLLNCANGIIINKKRVVKDKEWSKSHRTWDISWNPSGRDRRLQRKRSQGWKLTLDYPERDNFDSYAWYRMSHHQTATINKLGQNTGHFEPENGDQYFTINTRWH